MPIKRYVDYLQRRGQLEEYMQVLFRLPCNHSAATQLLTLTT